MKILLKISFSYIFIILLLFNIQGKTLLLDDFNSGLAENKFGGENIPFASVFPDPIASITPLFYSNPAVIFGRTGYSIRLDYDVSVSESYCGYALKLNKKDLSEYNYLSFWVRGKNGEEYFKIEIKSDYFNKNQQSAKFYITDYLDEGVTTKWQKIVIPLDAFISLGQWTNMNEFNIVFENSQSEVNGSLTKGTIYIDDILFGSWEPGFVRMDHYGDKIGIIGLGGNMGNGPTNNMSAPEWTIHSFTNIGYFSYEDILFEQSVLLRYQVTNFAFCYNIIGGGTNGSIKVESDFSDYSYVSFYAKALSSAENPKEMNFELKHEITGSISTLDPWTAYKRISISTNWTKYILNLSAFSGDTVHKTNINIYSFVFEHERIKLEGGATNGAVLIDNLQFEISSYSPDIVKPVIPFYLRSDKHTITNGYIFSTTNQLTVKADSNIDDLTIEGVFFGYSLDGIIWNMIGTDYDTIDNKYSITWDASKLENNSKVYLRVYVMDASGNISDYLTYNGVFQIQQISDSLKPDQKILTPNNDGINDRLVFYNILEEFEIIIFNIKGNIIKKLSEQNYWDGTDKDNELVESGLYLYVVKYKGKKISGSILVVK